MAEENGVDVSSQIGELEERAKQVRNPSVKTAPASAASMWSLLQPAALDGRTLAGMQRHTCQALQQRCRA